MPPDNKELAYNAGRALLTEPPERRVVEACPFPEGTVERDEWLRGLTDALDEHVDPATLRRAAQDAAKSNADARK